MLSRSSLCLGILAATAAAQFPSAEAAKFTNSFDLESFGQAVATDGQRVVVGSPFESLDTGRVHVYERVGGAWTLQESILHDGALNLDQLGAAVEIEGDVLAVGAPGGEVFNSEGMAFIFRWSGSDWVQELTVDGESSGDNLGTDVSLHGDLLAIGVPNDDDVNPGAGAVLLYRYDGAGWSLEKKLRPPGAPTNGSFGTQVAAGDGRVLVAGVLGKVHVFVKQGANWVVEQTLLGDVGIESDFGQTLALDGDVAVVGAPSEQVAFSSFGAAYVFRLACGGWEQQAKLVSPAASSWGFARAVDVDAGVVVVGDELGDMPAAHPGLAYAWRWDGFVWGLEQTLEPTSASAGDLVGHSVAVGGDVIVAGAVRDDDISLNSGAAYVFEATPVFEPWTDLGHALSAASGPPALLGGGSLLPGQPLQLTVQCGAPGAGAVLVAGFGQALLPFKGGILVPTPDLLLALALDGAGGAVLAAAWPAGVPSGTSFVLQAWVTDASGPAGYSASNGLLAEVP
jgi:FG-GAP repeat